MSSFTEEEMIGKNQLIEYLMINQASSDIQDTHISAHDVFSILLQYPSMLSRFKKIRAVIQSKINEFIVKPDLPPYLADILQKVQELLDELKYRADYVE
jgi:hypothetical protein